MSGNDDAPLLSAAEKISSGVPVDWSEISNQVTTAADAAVVQELRSLEQFAQLTGQAPSTWGRYQIVSEIGRGTFGTVYCAIDPTLQIEVALKVIRSTNPAAPLDCQRALEEARRLARVKHLNVVRVYAAELIDNEVGIAMEIVRGSTLDEIVRRRSPFSASEAAIIGIDLCRALAAVHGADILHGDIKAHNVMRENGGRTVLMDFGTGRSLKQQPTGPGKDFAGTPLYLAPEVFAGHARTPGSEIYSLGVLLYFLVTGRYPVEGDSRTEVERQHVRHDRRRPLRDVRADLPAAFIRVVERAAAENPSDRYKSAGELETALNNSLLKKNDNGWKRLVAFAAVMLLALGLGAMTVPRMMQRSAYRIESTFYREGNGVVERLKSGASVSQGDALSLQVQTSIPMYFYVVSEDEHGDSFLLFPLPGQALQNPLPPGQRHRLPSSPNGELLSWQVTTTGEKEHFLLVASPKPSEKFAELFATLPQPVLGSAPPQNAKLSADAIGVLRSIGGLTPSPARVDRQLRSMPEFSTPLAEGEQPGDGIWIRHATFGNPGR